MRGAPSSENGAASKNSLSPRTDFSGVSPRPITSSVNQSCRPAPTHAERFLFLPSSVVTILPRVGAAGRMECSSSLRSAIYPLQTGLSPSPCAGGSAPKPHPVAGFGCKVFKYLLGAHETLQDRPGSNLLTTRRFTRMAGRNSRYHHTLKRGLEQCSPTLKSATFSRSISSLRN